MASAIWEVDLTGDDHLQRLPTSRARGRKFIDRFTGRYDYRYGGLAVIAHDDGVTATVSTYPGVKTTVAGGDSAVAGQNDINSATAVYYGGDNWDVGQVSVQPWSRILVALALAGYTIRDTGR